MKLKVLLIEDDPLARKRLHRIIEKEGYEIDVACDGYEGLNSFREEKPDIVITDVKMPRIDGLEVMHRIKEMSHTTEVILITGHGDVDMAIYALREGALDYIKKPIDIDQLILSLGRAKEKIQKRVKINIQNSILIIEDNTKTRNMLVKIYEKEGYKVFAGDDGESGIQILSANKIDIILLDIQMPRKNGLEVLSEIRNITQDCEVIMLSGFGDESVAIEAMRKGAINIISKPIDIEQLLLATQKALDKLLLQRSYLFQARELELANQIINKISNEKEWVFEFSRELTQDSYKYALELINFINICYVLIDRELNIDYVNEYFFKLYRFIPQQIDKSFLEKLDIESSGIDQLQKSVEEFFDTSNKKIIKIKLDDSKHMLLMKVHAFKDDVREERGLLIVGGSN